MTVPVGPKPLTLPAAAAAAALALAVAGGAATAQDAWVPFPEPEAKRPSRTRAAAPPEDPRPILAPMEGQISRGQRLERPAGASEPGAVRQDALIREALPPLDEKSRAVDRGDLQPVMAADGSGLPLELWRGMDMKSVETLFAALELPPRSPALAGLWRRLITAEAAPPAGDTAGQFAALRAEALTRSGLIKEAGEAIATLPGGQADALAALMTARNEIALGRRDTACEAIKAAPPGAAIPAALKPDAILVGGYCAVSGGNTAAAGLTADLAREHGVEAGAGLAALDAIAAGTKPDLAAARRISPLEYRLIALAGGGDARLIADKATAATLAAIASDAAAETELRTAAGEGALRLNAIAGGDLAAIYRVRPATAGADSLLAAGGGAGPDGPLRRAALFTAAEAERTQIKKVRLVRAFLDDARRGGLYLPALAMMAPAAEAVAPVAEIGWFAETAIEIALAAGDYERARSWVRFAAGIDRGQFAGEMGPLGHWLALADIADPKLARGRGASLESVEQLALRGRFAPDLLHRLATVLDALDTHVPIPLWDAASRTPQPATGHLPETGVLSALLEASKKKEFGRTVLIAMTALGPTGAEGAHMIALGDSIRALKRAGLETEARKLGFEALFASWPRAAAH